MNIQEKIKAITQKCIEANPDNREKEKEYPILREYPVSICDACINLKGQMCHTPGCAFIRCSMAEVKELLNQTQIRPLLDGKPIYVIDPI